MRRLFKKIEVLTDEDLAQLARMIDSRYVGKVVFECSVCPNPERDWNKDHGMIRYSYGRQQKLIDLGLADHEFFESIRDQKEPDVILAIEIDAATINLDAFFDSAARMQLVDIYLYNNGVLMFNYD